MTIFWSSCSIALRNLFANKMRSALTLLGMFIGVMAVITIVSLGEGVKAFFAKEIGALGGSIMYAVPEPPNREGVNRALIQARPFKLEQIDALAQQNTTLKKVMPSAIEPATFKYQNRNVQGEVTGGDEAFLELNNYKLASGRFITHAEAVGKERVAVLGADLAEQLFAGYEEPLGATVRIAEQPFRVIGTLKRRGSRGGAPNIDKQAVLPTGVILDRITGSDDVYWVYLQMKEGVDIEAAKADVIAILRRQRAITDPTKDDFQIISPDDFLEFGNTFINVLVGVFGFIGAISLLVGGIGISNIMLVAVTERTREIGLRKALGAPPRAILTQFIIEAIVLTSVGGLLGMAGGYGAAYGFMPLLRKLFASDAFTPTVPVAIALATVGVSVAIGLAFGVYPAWKASRLNPIDALRYE